ncbi:hypothetical protein TWF730_005054 [Orbilia blumenaviensis]|uniref:Uncharacterized protein n=1 Tax=Orbilia blumenaviensis TaxID=1796055 RepID=A0AAV9VJF1_9PEZI
MSGLIVQPWVSASIDNLSKNAAVWSLLVPKREPGMWKYIKYVELAVEATGSAITVNTTSVVPGLAGPVREFKLTDLDDKAIEIFSIIQGNCRFSSFNTHTQNTGRRFEVLYEVKTVDETWQEASLAEREFFACWPAVPSDPNQIQTSKLALDITKPPRLFGVGDVPGFDCHQVWLYVTYYGYNYNVKKPESGSDASDENLCDDSELVLIEEPLGKVEDEEAWSNTSGTDQVLTPQEIGERARSHLQDDVDSYAKTPLIEDLENEGDYGIIDLKDQPIVENNRESTENFFLRKASDGET